MKTPKNTPNRLPGNRPRIDGELYAYLALFTVAVAVLVGSLVQGSRPLTFAGRTNDVQLADSNTAPTVIATTNFPQCSNGMTLPQKNS